MEKEKEMNCTSCNMHIHASGNFVKFKCPACSEELIIRCEKCKAAGVKYKCKKCEFVGP
jgi:predicted RNA-binding Zn-ribbon protein involved in translation (DUF1610 family)